jgi:hypothetical protein
MEGCLQSVPHLHSDKQPETTPAEISDKTSPCIWRPASSSLIHRGGHSFAASASDTTFFAVLRTLCYSPQQRLFQQREFPSAWSPVHLFDRALLISLVAFAFVRSIAASSPLSTFATPQATPRNKHHSDTSLTCRRRREARSRAGRNKRSRHRTVLPPGNQHG